MTTRPEIESAYRQGWNAAIEASADVAIKHGDLLEIHSPRIAEEIRKLRKDIK